MKSRLQIEISGLPIALSIEERYLSLVRDYYRIFTTSKSSEILIEVELIDGFRTANGPWAEFGFKADTFTESDDCSSGSFDLGVMAGKISINPVSLLPSLGTYLRNICSFLSFLRDEGIVLHAAAVLQDGEAFLFTAPSGGGKSTVAGCSLERTVLSDDHALIKQINGEYFVFPHPAWGDKQKGTFENKPYKINSIFRLIKDTRVFVQQMPLAYAIADIFTLPKLPVQLIPHEKLISRFLNLVSAAPYYGLHFLPDASFWPCINSLKPVQYKG